jgi:hypothetical protein
VTSRPARAPALTKAYLLSRMTPEDRARALRDENQLGKFQARVIYKWGGDVEQVLYEDIRKERLTKPASGGKRKGPQR